MRKPLHLSKREQQIMDVVYTRGVASVTEVWRSLPDPPTRTSVRTILHILEEKGHLRHLKKGQEFIYEPTRARRSAGLGALHRVLATFFEGSLERAVATHLSDAADKLSTEELTRLAAVVREAQKRVDSPPLPTRRTAMSIWARAMAIIEFDAALKSAVVLAAAYTAVLIMRRASAAARHAVLALGMAAALAIPILSLALPQLRLLPAWTATPPSPVIPTERPPWQPLNFPGRTAATRQKALGTPVMPAGPIASPAWVQAAGPAAPRHSRWVWLGTAWLAGAGITLLPVILGAISLWRLSRRAAVISDQSWVDLLAHQSGQLGLRRAVRLLWSPDRTMPMSWGLWRPKVLLPAEASAWPGARRSVVLLHELAHVRRRDCVTQFIAQLACALYWFNPLVWVVLAHLRIERERACDDLVLRAGSRASDYADELLRIASGLRAPMLASYSAVAMARPSALEGRLLAILDPHKNRRTLTHLGLGLFIAVIVAVATPVAMLHAKDGDAAALAPTTARATTSDARTPDAPVGGTAFATFRALVLQNEALASVIKFKYSVHFKNSNALEGMLRNMGPNRKAEGTASTGVENVLWAQDGPCFYLSSSVSRGDAEPDSPDIMACNGELLKWASNRISMQVTVENLSRDASVIQNEAQRIGFCQFDGRVWLSDALAPGYVTSVTETVLFGRPAYVVGIHYKENQWSRFWLDKERGVPLRLAYYTGDPALPASRVGLEFTDIVSHQLSNGGWMPVKGVSYFWDAHPDDGPLITREVAIDVDSITINPKDIPKRLFEMSFPPGARVGNVLLGENTEMRGTGEAPYRIAKADDEYFLAATKQSVGNRLAPAVVPYPGRLYFGHVNEPEFQRVCRCVVLRPGVKVLGATCASGLVSCTIAPTAYGADITVHLAHQPRGNELSGEITISIDGADTKQISVPFYFSNKRAASVVEAGSRSDHR